MNTGTPRRRVLVVAHNAVADSNRARVDALAADPSLELCLVTPRWWEEEGRRIEIRAPRVERYTWRVARTWATNNGTRYIYTSQLATILRDWQPHVIDAYEEPFSFAAFQLALLRRAFVRRAALVVYSAVNVDRRWRWPYRATERLVLKVADGASVPSSEVGPVLRRKGLMAPVATIPLGIDIERFGRAQPLDILSAGATTPIVGYLGRFEPVKGLSYLLDAFARLNMQATLVLAGSGSEREALEGSVTAAGLSHRVRVLPPLAFAQVPSFLKALDVLVLPSITIWPTHREQFGRVLVEAMAAGTAVIGTTSGAIPEVIGDAGLIVPERDSGALTSALRRMLGDSCLRAELARRGRDRASEYYAWPAIARLTRSLYEAAIDHRRRALSRD